MMNIDTNYILLLVGIAFLGAGLYQWARFIKLRKSGIRIKGTIYDLVKRSVGDEGEERLFLVIKFMTLDYQQVIKETEIIAADGAKYTTADTINVVYDPRDPENCVIYEKEKMPHSFLILLGIGTVIILLAVIAMCSHHPDLFWGDGDSD